jgi:hypothetical protein
MFDYSMDQPAQGHKWSSKDWQTWAKASGAYLEGSLEECGKCAAPPQFILFLDLKNGENRVLFVCRGHKETTYPMASTIYLDYNRAGFRELVA